MRLGCCVGDEAELAIVEAAGADYCELPVAKLVMGADGAFEGLARRLEGSPAPPLACNVFLPGELKVVGPAVDAGRVEAYVREACTRLQRLGCRLLVFGSGRARSVPDGFDRARGLDQLAAFARLAGAAAAARGLRLVLEPLGRAESNVCNTVAESAAFLRERGLADVSLLADLYHMSENGEELSSLAGCADLLVHAHVAGSGRLPPGRGDGPVEEFLRRLHEAGYQGGCSIECRWTDFAAQAPPALAWLRDAAGRAGFAA